MKRTLFLVFSCAIVVFSIICLCTGPIINGIIKDSGGWGTNNCKEYSDKYKYEKDHNGDDDTLKSLKKSRNLCNRQKAMYGLEYSSYIIDVSLGFICAVLGLLHFFDIGKSFQKYSGLIGLITGIVGFVLTLVYIIYSGYIFTKDLATDHDGSNFADVTTTIFGETRLLKLNGKGAFAKKDGDGGKFKCIYYNKDNKYAILAKYNDLGKKSFNYEKKRNYDKPSDITNCDIDKGVAYTKCSNSETFTDSDYSSCDYLYLDEYASGFGNKYLYDNWVTNIIFGCFIIACNIGLAIFGFLVFKNSDGSGI